VITGLDEQYLVAIGTVTGSGLVAALAKTVLSGAVRKFGPISRSPQALVHRLNRLLARLNDDLRERWLGCSLFVGVVDRRRCALEYCSAGACRPQVWARDGVTTRLELTGSALTGSPESEHDGASLDLVSLRRMIICTDGLAAAASPDGAAFGTGRALRLFQDTADLPADGQAEAIVETVRRHIGRDRVPAADVTVLVTDFAQGALSREAHAWSARLQGEDRGIGTVPDSSVFLG
jgi:serine phosphatase RsbU (regulator of sigma subunit)